MKTTKITTTIWFQNHWVMKLRPAAARCLQPKKDYKYVPNYDTLFSTYPYFIFKR